MIEQRLRGLGARLGFGRTAALLALLVGALLALVALASRTYSPLSGERGEREPSAEFFDYFFTAAAILWAVGAVTLVFLYVGEGRRDPKRLRIRIGPAGLVFLVGVVLLLVYGSDLFDRLRENAGAGKAASGTTTATTPFDETSGRGEPRSPEFEWPLAVIAGIGAVLLAGVLGRRHFRQLPAAQESLAAALAAELDDTLDDLRHEPDPRRAVIAAYARMERLLAARGVDRRPAEAPLEYLERVLLELDAGHTQVARLTALFAEAKFSAHEVGPALKDDAIDALVEIRDRLRGSQ